MKNAVYIGVNKNHQYNSKRNQGYSERVENYKFEYSDSAYVDYEVAKEILNTYSISEIPFLGKLEKADRSIFALIVKYDSGDSLTKIYNYEELLAVNINPKVIIEIKKAVEDAMRKKRVMVKSNGCSISLGSFTGYFERNAKLYVRTFNIYQ